MAAAFLSRSKDGSVRSYHRVTAYIKRHPLGSLLIALALLFGLILLAHFTQKTPVEQPQKATTRNVHVYSIGEAPKATFQAKIEKSGIVKISAQSPGIVQKIYFREGQKVAKGQQIINLSTNYQGGNAPAIQRQIAQTQYQNVVDTFGTQMDLINKQRDVATMSAQSAQDTRDITRQSVNDTNGLINSDQSLLDSMNTSLTALKNGGGSATDINTLQGSINTLQGGLNQLKAANRSSDYQSSNDKSPAQMASLQKDITLNQLDLQAKTLQLNKEVNGLQVSLAAVSEALMYPASPFAGTVERINVKVGQAVAAGTVLATVTSNDVQSTAVLLVPQNIAATIQTGEPSQIQVGERIISATPYYVSSEATDGQLYSVIYDIPADEQDSLTDGDYVNITVPIGQADTTAAAPLIPIDAIYQTQQNAYVLVTENGKAVNRTVTTGQVFGNYAEIPEGLRSGDQIILDRNVIAGDSVKIQ